MTARRHAYEVRIVWTGNRGTGTSGYTAYEREHELSAPGKPVIPASADPAFRGDPTRYNPEELLVSSLSACHMLWYLHLCSDAGVVVTKYEDEARGVMEETPAGGGRFVEVVLRPRVTVSAASDPAAGRELHGKAHAMCFIAASVNFPVRCEPEVEQHPA